jgi:hypothetical protein
MEVNLKKTKVMIFQKGNKKKTKPSFTLDNKTIEIVQEYCYLGIKLNSNGKFTLAMKQLGEKALHALYSIRRHLNLHNLNPKLAIKIFDTIISPILLYNSEVWGVYTKNDFNNWDNSQIEKTHLRFCKLYLGVGRKTTNIACRGEPGKFPLIINIYKRLFKYIIHLNSLPEEALAKQAFLISKDLHSKRITSFYGNIMDILKSYNCNTQITDLESITIQTLSFIHDNIKQKYLTFWKHKLENSSKLKFYNTFKTEYQLEKYLSTIKNPTERKTLTKFRVSNHKLMIELGRYKKIPREERLCEICQSGEVEDEYHFANSCKANSNQRDNFYTTLRNKLTIITDQAQLVDIMKSTEHGCNKQCYAINVELTMHIFIEYKRDDMLCLDNWGCVQLVNVNVLHPPS